MIKQTEPQEWMIHCPVCDFDYSHHGDIKEYTREKEDGRTYVQTTGSDVKMIADYNPSARREAIRIYFEGECGHEWWMNIVQHKGQTFLSFDVTVSATEEELKERARNPLSLF